MDSRILAAAEATLRMVRATDPSDERQAIAVIVRALEAAMAEEREACAKVVDMERLKLAANPAAARARLGAEIAADIAVLIRDRG